MLYGSRIHLAQLPNIYMDCCCRADLIGHRRGRQAPDHFKAFLTYPQQKALCDYLSVPLPLPTVCVLRAVCVCVCSGACYCRSPVWCFDGYLVYTHALFIPNCSLSCLEQFLHGQKDMRALCLLVDCVRVCKCRRL